MIHVVHLRLPMPPSVNSYRAIFDPKRGKARLITSAAGRAYHKAVVSHWKQHWGGNPPKPMEGRLRMTVEVCYRDRRAIDLDNRVKPLQDALEMAGAYLNDSQIDDLWVVRGPVSGPDGFVDVMIEDMDQGGAK